MDAVRHQRSLRSQVLVLSTLEAVPPMKELVQITIWPPRLCTLSEAQVLVQTRQHEAKCVDAVVLEGLRVAHCERTPDFMPWTIAIDSVLERTL
jgi:hypothetical protein